MLPLGCGCEAAGDSGRELGGVSGWSCSCESDGYLSGSCDRNRMKLPWRRAGDLHDRGEKGDNEPRREVCCPRSQEGMLFMKGHESGGKYGRNVLGKRGQKCSGVSFVF